MTGETGLNGPRLAAATYISVRGTAGAAFLLAGAAPAAADIQAHIFPLMNVTGTLILISWGLVSGREWGWIGGVAAVSILLLSNLITAALEPTNPILILFADSLALAGMFHWRDSIQDREMQEEGPFEAIGVVEA